MDTLLEQATPRRKGYAPTDPAIRFWAKVDMQGNQGGCWVWTGAKSSLGYGRFRLVTGTVQSHRWAWEQAAGYPVPDGLEVCHRCDNPPCVRYDHLFLGTRADNERDKIAKGRRGDSWAKITHCPRGHAYTPENTRVYGRSRACRACHRERWRERRAAALATVESSPEREGGE